MLRILIAGLLGGLAMYVFLSVAHLSPLGQVGVHTLPNGDAMIAQVSDAAGGKAGLYFFPDRMSKKSSAATGPQGFSETFYAYLSQANNNGSAFAGYAGYIQPNAGNVGAHGIKFADILGGFTMLLARYAPILFALGVAGALAGKRVSPAGLGTMRTDNPTFVVLLIGVIVLVGALTFFPALLLGPIVQGLTGHLY